VTAPPKSLLDLTLELLAIPSVIGNERAIADAVETKLRSRAARVVRHQNSLAASGPRRGKPLVALVGHLDTVAAAEEAAFIPKLEGARIVGLGSSDMKGAIACDLWILEHLDLDALDVDLAWILYEKEEGPIADNGLLPLLEAVPELREVDLAICGEPTDNAVQLGCMGSAHARVVFAGRAAHSARPWQGENAVHKAAGMLSALASRAPREVMLDGLPFREVISATLAQGGRSRNVVPDRFELNLNIRFAAGRSRANVEAEVRALASEASEVNWIDFAPAAPPRGDHALVRRLVQRTGAAVEPKQAWTDVAQLSQIGIAAVNFGPGEQAQAHQRGESISVELLGNGLELRRKFLGG